MTVRPHAPPSKWNPEHAGLSFDVRVLAMVLVMLLLAIATATGLLPFWAGFAGSVAVTALILFGFLTREGRFRSFERDFAKALQLDPEKAEDVYSRALLVRLFTPRALLLPKKALIALEKQRFDLAARYLEHAWLAMPRDHRNRLLGPLVRAKAGAGQWSDVLVLASDWSNVALSRTEPLIYEAAALLETGAPDASRRASELIAAIDSASGLSRNSSELLAELRRELRRRQVTRV